MPPIWMLSGVPPGGKILPGWNMPKDPAGNPTLLVVFSSIEDQATLGAILDRSDRDLLFTQSFTEARTALHAFRFQAVISDGLFSDGHCWKDLLREIEDMADRPPLIVADRHADERLWVEVLNLGAWDLITKPFDAREVLHVMSGACGFGKDKEPIIRTPEQPGVRAARSGT
jgi:DNA-binding NtrC family response regulator